MTSIFNTDLVNSFGSGEKKYPRTMSFEEIYDIAIQKKAMVICRPNTGNFWYIKSFNGKKTFQQIKNHIHNNIENQYRPNTKLWLIAY